MNSKKAHPASPGRPREFDIDDAVRDALAVFQARGYHAASLVDLIEGTGLVRGSLYKAFTDKHAIFLAALDRYTSEGLNRLRGDLNKGSAREAIQATLRYYARLSSALEGQRGCVVTAAATELLPVDEEVRQRVAWMFESMRALLADTIRRGQATGEISNAHSPDAFARFLLCTIEGMRVLGKLGPNAKEMTEVAAITMRMLG